MKEEKNMNEENSYFLYVLQLWYYISFFLGILSPIVGASRARFVYTLYSPCFEVRMNCIIGH